MEKPDIVTSNDFSRLPLQMGAIFALLVVVSSSLTGIGVPVTIVRSLLAFLIGMGLGFALVGLLPRPQQTPPKVVTPTTTTVTKNLPVAAPDEQDLENG